MKRRFVAFVSALFLAVSPGVVAQEAPASLSLTVDQAVEYALDKNKSVASARYDLLASEKAKWEAIAAGLPTLTQAPHISNNLAVMTRIIDFGGVPTPLKFGTAYDDFIWRISIRPYFQCARGLLVYRPPNLQPPLPARD